MLYLEIRKGEHTMEKYERNPKGKKIEIPVYKKYTLTIKEASEYFNIGEKRMRQLAEENAGGFAVLFGYKYLIIRCRFERFLDSLSKGEAEIVYEDEGDGEE